MKKRTTILICVMFILSHTLVVASGYQVLLQGNRQTGNGNIGVSLFPDASSIFFNPGSLGFMRHNNLIIGGNLIFAGNTYWDSEVDGSLYKVSSNNPAGTPFHVYGVWGPEDQPWKVGLGIYTPYGSGVDWGNEWMGQYLLRRISLKTIFFQPTVAYQLNETISVGGGFVYAIGNVNLQRGLPISSSVIDPSVELNGGASGVGYNLGVFMKLSSKLNLGLNYRSKVNMKVNDGDATFSVPSGLSTLFPAGNTFDAELPLPANFSIGLTYAVSEKLSLSTEANWVGWSAYDTLSFDFKENTNMLADINSPRQYKDSWVFKLGAEFKTTDKLTLRVGGYYDQTPVKEGYMTPETPDASRIGLTAGVSYKLSDRLNLDASFLFINGMERRQTTEDAIVAGTINPSRGRQDVLPGTYQLNAFIPGVSISYNF